MAFIERCEPTETDVQTHQVDGVYLRKIQLPPSKSIVFAQALSSQYESLSAPLFTNLCKQVGWYEEANTIEKEAALIYQSDALKAPRFSHGDESATTLK